MPRLALRTMCGLALAGAAVGVVTHLGSRRWLALIEEQEQALLTWPEESPGDRRVDFRELASLPAPVAKYLRLVLTDGQSLVRVARFRQHGRLRTDPDGGRWMSFQARQMVAPLSSGFVWDARIRLPLALHVRVRDAYLGGVGQGGVSLQSTIPLGADRGTPELNLGELYRFLAEAVWYPTALLPGLALVWSAIDDQRALAVLSHGAATASVEFRFNTLGEVIGIYAANRPRLDGRVYRMTPWEGHFSGYAPIQGMRVPSQADVGWHLAGQWQAVWEGTVTDPRYEFAP